jgi:hypothetical protein
MVMELVPEYLDGLELQALAGIDWYLVCAQSSFSGRISFRSPGNSSLGLKDKTHRRQCKCCHQIKLNWEGTLRQVFICLRPRTPPNPPYTLYTCVQYTYLQREGGRVEPGRRLDGHQFTKLGRKYQHD